MDWLSFLSDAAVKAAVVLAAALLIELILRKCSAAGRHLVWTMAAITAIGMPILTALLPTWHVLPVAAPAQNEQVVIDAPAPVINTDMPAPAQMPSAFTAEVVSDAAPTQPEPARSDWSWTTWIIAAWAIGAVAMLIPAAVGMLSLMRLSARSAKIQDEYWLNLCGDLSSKLELKRKIALLSSAERAMPMTWGILRPKVLLPAEAGNWPAERQRLVLMHELAHVRRRDGLAQLLGQLTRAAYWFNPLCWVAVRRMAHLRERACDDMVLNLGIKASDYAEQLLTVATGYRAMAGGIAMARSSKLETRLRAILDGHIDRRNLTQRAVVFVALALAGVAIPLATMGTRAKAQEAAPAPAPAPGATDAVAPVAPDAPQAPAVAVAAPVLKDQGDYKIGKNDELSVSIFDLMGEGTGEHVRLVRVSETGNVALDFIRPLHVEGLTEQEAVDAVRKAYIEASIIRNPRVLVEVTQKHDDEIARLKAEVDRDEKLLSEYKATKAPQLTDSQQREMDAVMRRAQLQLQQAQVQIDEAKKVEQLQEKVQNQADAFRSRAMTQPSATGVVNGVSPFAATPHDDAAVAQLRRYQELYDQQMQVQLRAGEMRGLTFGAGRYVHPGIAENWSAKLDNDVTVQLIGVSEHPSKNRPWWKPDGSPLTEAPYDDFGRKLELGNEPMGREFAIRLANPKNVQVDFSWSLQPATSQTVTGQLTKNGQPVTDIRAAATTLAADGSTTTLLLGVASGQWRMSGEHNHLDLPEGMKNPWGNGDVLFAPANETVAGLEETVSYSVSDGDVRLVAIGADGKEMKSSWSSSSGQGAIGMVTARFKDLHTADVVKFVLQTRPYQWVEFDKVALWGKQ